MNSKELLKEFISKNGINETSMSYVEERINKFYEIYEDINDIDYDEEVFSQIITDLFYLNSENLKMISDYVIKKNITIGRRHKHIAMKYLNYRQEEDLKIFIDTLGRDNKTWSLEIETELIQFIKSLKCDFSEEANKLFVEFWTIAEENNDVGKLSDYLFGIFSRVYKYYARNSMNLNELYNYNKKYIGSDLTQDSIKHLENMCSNTIDIDNEEVVLTFYEEYIKLLNKELREQSLLGQLEPVMNQIRCDDDMLKESYIYDRGTDLALVPTESFNSVYLTLNQEVFDKFADINGFYDYVLNAIIQSYRILENNKVLGIQIDNIYSDNRNIKWDLYAHLGVFAERFIKTKEYRNFFKPETLCIDMMSKSGIAIREGYSIIDLEKDLKQYYKGKKGVKIDSVYEFVVTDLNLEEFKEYVDQWQYTYYGFSFNDCLVIKGIDEDTHERELPFIKNNNCLLMIFYKYRMDERKIPCPVCGGLRVVGNSYPEVGHRSWECKNIICPKRSKSNRGKRYSFKSNYMQIEAANPKPENLIEKQFLLNWRKDIVSVDSADKIYEMFIRYFSFCSESILFINTGKSCIDIAKFYKRNPILISINGTEKNVYISPLDEIELENNLYRKYFIEGEYIKRFVVNKETLKNENLANSIKTLLNDNSQIKFINGDSFTVLNNVEPGTISSAVTSPPYYNAREYSQWPNLYLYLIDMYNIIKSTKVALKTGGVFLYNIGDINGNENTIAMSNMGNKRMLLGAYSILIFKAAGYELVENIIWDKGEPQSKRNTNDGNFTPHYQKPINSYEHMFIFKKREDKVTINENTKNQTWNENVVQFPPVIKINSNGVNILGHTAPFPKDIPNFVANMFNIEKTDIILDPFSGSGTTAITAADNGYIGLGIELSKEYMELSIKIAKEDNNKVNTLYL